MSVRFGERSALHLPRHGPDAALAPHRINYRAHLDTLHQLGVTQIVAVNAVGAIDPCYHAGALVLPHQLIDYTRGRQDTFFDGVTGPLKHVDFSQPFCATLGAQLADAALTANVHIATGGVYGCTNGPRLETAAEIRRMARDGCDLVGMTAYPEAVLARELNIDYASLCFVVNLAAGVAETPVSETEARTFAKCAAVDVEKVLSAFLQQTVASV